MLNEDNSGDLYEADPISALCTTGFVFIYADIRMKSGSMNSVVSVQEHLVLFCWIAFSYIFTNSNFFYNGSIYLLNRCTHLCRSHCSCMKSGICLYVQ